MQNVKQTRVTRINPKKLLAERQFNNELDETIERLLARNWGFSYKPNIAHEAVSKAINEILEVLEKHRIVSRSRRLVRDTDGN